MWTNAQNVRDLLGLDIDTATDNVLEEFIGYAMSYLRKYIQVSIVDGGTSGNINGTNNTFSTYYNYYADISGDTLITTADISVYGWVKNFPYDPFKRAELTISTFDPLRGKIVLTAAPSQDDYGRITVDYSYFTKRIDWELLSLATAWKAAELWVKREEYLVPESYTFGNKRITQKQPWKLFEIEVRRLVDKLIALPMDKVTYRKLVFRPRGPEGPEVDSSAAKELRQRGRVYRADPEIETNKRSR